MNSDNSFDGGPAALDLSTYKQLGYYQLLDPNGPRVCGYHVYRTVLKIFLATVQLVTIFGVTGFFVEAEGDADPGDGKSNSFELVVILTNCSLSSLKMYTLASNSTTIWRLFDLARADFLTCSRHGGPIAADFARRCRRSAAVAKWIARSFLAGMVLWMMGPFIGNELQSGGGRRYKNIVDIKFPVAVKTYNDHYFAFYAMEVAVGFCIVYGSVLVDAFLMSFCWIISAQYQSVAKAFATFGHDGPRGSPEEMYRDFKTILIDHQNVYLKMKSFYAVVRPITLIHVFAYSCSLIMYTYVIVTIFHSKESFVIAEIMKIVMTVSNVTIEVFIFCYLFELIDNKKEDVNFGLYSCNWTGMDIKFKQLLLMSMKMNNANRLKLKATPDVTVDRPFFANVIHTCFKIVSVLIQTQSKDIFN